LRGGEKRPKNAGKSLFYALLYFGGVAKSDLSLSGRLHFATIRCFRFRAFSRLRVSDACPACGREIPKSEKSVPLS